MEEKKLSRKILHDIFVEQDRLIAEGKMEKPKIIYGFSPEGQKAFDEGFTLDEIEEEMKRKYGLE
jgi:cytochrome c-type biogenesis protein CcmE